MNLVVLRKRQSGRGKGTEFEGLIVAHEAAVPESGDSHPDAKPSEATLKSKRSGPRPKYLRHLRMLGIPAYHGIGAEVPL